jgi:hypothetical protein
MQRVLTISVAGVAALAGCEEHGQSPPDADESGCRGDNDRLEDGRVVDGSEPAQKIAGAMIVVPGDATRSATTDAEGEFSLCVSRLTLAPYTIDPPDDWMPGVFHQSWNLGRVDVMTFTASKLTAVLAAVGQTYDPSTGIVIASGDMPTLTGPHGARLGLTSQGWIEVQEGPNTFMFPNAPPGMQDVNGVRVQVTAGAIVWVNIPLIPI